MNIINKIKIFKEYIKIINKHKIDLSINYNIRVDKAYRMYTVINIPPEYTNSSYNITDNSTNLLTNLYIRRYLNKLTEYFNSIGLIELYRIYEFKKIYDNSYLLIIGFSLFKSTVYYNILYFVITPVFVLFIIIFCLFLFV